MRGKESFLMYHSFYDPVKDFSLDDKGRLFDAVFQYQNDGKIPELTSALKVAFLYMKGQFDRDAEKYQNICDRNRNNGIKGGRKRRNPEEPKKPSGILNNPKNPVGADTDTDTDTDTDNNILNEFKKFRKEYPGRKVGLTTEFNNFLKKNKPDIVYLLLPALYKEIAFKEQQKKASNFDEAWPHLKTWINQKRWEQEFPIIGGQSVNGKQVFRETILQES